MNVKKLDDCLPAVNKLCKGTTKAKKSQRKGMVNNQKTQIRTPN